MKIIGLTGGMGMGKSAVTKWLLVKGIPVYDADARVHFLYRENKKLINELEQLVPGCTTRGSVDRKILSKWVMAHTSNLPRLSKVVSPYLNQDRKLWIAEQRLRGTKRIVCDFPLLFESTNINEWDRILCVDVLPIWQRKRILKREGLTVQKMQFLLGNQWSNSRRKVYSTDIIHTGLSLRGTHRELIRLFRF